MCTTTRGRASHNRPTGREGVAVALQVCPTPGCPALTPTGPCPTCRKAKARARGSARSKGYDRRWERTRAAYLDEHPLCECETHTALPPLLRPLAEHVHHLDGLGPRGPRGHDPSNLQALTQRCHARVTAIEEPGGWNVRD